MPDPVPDRFNLGTVTEGADGLLTEPSRPDLFDVVLIEPKGHGPNAVWKTLLLEEVADWCFENTSGYRIHTIFQPSPRREQTGHDLVEIEFKTSADAVAFKLRWL